MKCSSGSGELVFENPTAVVSISLHLLLQVVLRYKCASSSTPLSRPGTSNIVFVLFNLKKKVQRSWDTELNIFVFEPNSV